MLYKKPAIIACMLLAVLLLAACGSGSNQGGDSETGGKELFEQSTIGAIAGCRTCHSLEPGTTIIGPSLAEIGVVADSRVPGLSAEEYLKQSIIDPNAFIVEGYPASVMPNVYAEHLTEEQIDQLVAFMLSLKGDGG